MSCTHFMLMDTCHLMVALIQRSHSCDVLHALQRTKNVLNFFKVEFLMKVDQHAM